MDRSTNDTTLPVGHTLGEYRIEAVLGQGGFGITYLANDNNLGTRVALKEYFPASLALREDNFDISSRPTGGDRGKELYLWGLQQFIQEARALAQFKHNNIVRVLRFFEAHKTAYMVMEYEQGQTLAEHLGAQGNRLTEKELLRTFLPILNGLQAIHGAGVLHLDIKPDNIYLRSDGTPMLIDFGSARQPTNTADSDLQPITLTPAYAAVEQYPDRGTPGPWTDVYAMGAAMYRCVTGISPAGGLQRAEALRQLQPDPLAQLERLQIPEFPRYVLECIDWALEIDPTRRPQSARLLQEGLMGRGRPGGHRPPPVAPAAKPAPPAADAEFALGKKASVDSWKIVRWTVATVLLLAIGITGFQYWRTSPGKAPVNLAAAARRQVANLPTKQLYTLMRHQAPVRTVVFLNGDRELLSADKSGQVLLWDARSGDLVRQLADGSDGGTVVTAPTSGRWFAVAVAGGIDLRQIKGDRTLRSLAGLDGTVTRLAASDDGARVAIGNTRGDVLLEPTSGKGHALRIHSGGGAVTALAFSADGNLLASANADGTVALWNTGNGAKRFRAHTAAGGAAALALSRDRQWLAAGGSGGTISLWNPGGNAPLRTLQANVDQVDALAFSPDGEFLYSGLSNNDVAILSTANGAFHNILTGQNGSVRGLALSPDGLTLATAGDDNMVLVWSAWAPVTGQH